MTIKSKFLNFTGYIEGYYGKLLSWDDRNKIINRLKTNGMSSYLYAPKEDIYHRLEWRKLYPQKILKSFISFIEFSKIKKIEIIVGIAPGLDFDYNNLYKEFINKNHSDLKTLEKKCRQIISFGARNIALMFDDVDQSKYFQASNEKEEGFLHGKIANHLKKKLKVNIFVVPRIYSDELILTNKYYLDMFFKTLNNEIQVFYCGSNIVAKSLSFQNLKIFSRFKNKIIIWDNFYANDYCPKRIFLGKLYKRTIKTNIMMNLTGMIETDLFLLDIFNIYLKKQNSVKKWKEILNKHKVPHKFTLISPMVLHPFTILKDDKKNISKYIDAIDFLLWKWKSPLSREWYPFLFNLKKDLLIRYDLASTKQILKTETLPLGEYLTKINDNLLKSDTKNAF